jgi:putative spermidine/putrescine transport system permease protein
MSGSSETSGSLAGATDAGARTARAARFRRKRRPLWAPLVVVIAIVYFLLPLYATGVFAFSTGKAFTLQPLFDAIADTGFHDALILSLFFAIGSTVVAVAIVAPTSYLIELRFPRLRALFDFITILPFVIPPIILTLGLEEIFGLHGVLNLIGSPILLIGGYFALTLPFVYRAIGNGLRAIDVKTLTEAAESLGAGPVSTFLQVIVPSISTALLSGALLAFTTVMGEFTLASLMGYATFPVFLNNINASAPREASSLVIVSFVITWVGVLALALVARRTPGGRQVAVAR